MRAPESRARGVAKRRFPVVSGSRAIQAASLRIRCSPDLASAMAYDEDLAHRIRQLLADEAQVTERKMFGGLAFLVNGNMAIAASGQGGILVRYDPRKAMPAGAGPAIMRGRPMHGWLRVSDDKLKTKTRLGKWARIGATYARSLPPKH